MKRPRRVHYDSLVALVRAGHHHGLAVDKFKPAIGGLDEFEELIVRHVGSGWLRHRGHSSYEVALR